MSKTVADFLLERLREWGVKRIYGYPGDGINGILGAMNRAGNDPPGVDDRMIPDIQEHRIHSRGILLLPEGKGWLLTVFGRARAGGPLLWTLKRRFA